MFARLNLAPLLALFFTLLWPIKSLWAHPHVWVVARAEIVFDKDGKIAGIRHSWTFDEYYSAFATEGLGSKEKPPTREQLAPLAKTNIDSMAEFDYFTIAKQNEKPLIFDAPRDYWLESDEKKLVTLHFTLPFKTPVSAHKPVMMMVYDSSFFVDFQLATDKAVTMEGAPTGCSLSTIAARPLDVADAQKMTDSAATGLPIAGGGDFGIKLAARSIIACP